jgi:hypothetical protein
MTLFTAKMTAEIYATPVGVAVQPLRAVAMDNAEERARAVIAATAKDLAEANGDVQVTAPYPYNSHMMARHDAEVARARHSRFMALTSEDPSKPSRHGMRDPIWRVMDEARGEKFVTEARDFAAGQYDAFVAKLNNKIGPHATAVLEGNHVWGESFLTVTFAADRMPETWKTQQIWNVSKLGKDFPQWPSRKLKVARVPA